MPVPNNNAGALLVVLARPTLAKGTKPQNTAWSGKNIKGTMFSINDRCVEARYHT